MHLAGNREQWANRKLCGPDLPDVLILPRANAQRDQASDVAVCDICPLLRPSLYLPARSHVQRVCSVDPRLHHTLEDYNVPAIRLGHHVDHLHLDPSLLVIQGPWQENIRCRPL